MFAIKNRGDGQLPAGILRGGIYGKRAVGDKYLATNSQAVAENLSRLVAHNLYLSVEIEVEADCGVV